MPVNNDQYEGLQIGQRYAFDGFEVDSRERLLLRDGEPLQLTSKVFDVLLAFLENPGRLLSKEELLDKVWREEAVEEGNLARHVSTLRKVLEDRDKEHKYIVTVQGRGYRFVADVRKSSAVPVPAGAVAIAAAALSADRATGTTDTPVGTSPRAGSRRWLWVVPLVAVLLFAAAWIERERIAPAASPIKSLAVLPFKSLDDSDRLLGAGIADAVIRSLGATHLLAVRPLSAVLQYDRSKSNTDALAAAKALNVDAVLEGTVQRAEQRLRVSVNLLRTSDGVSIWSDRYDLPAAGIFEIQDRVAGQVGSTLRLELAVRNATSPGDRHPASLVAYEWYIKGIFSLDQRDYDEAAKPQMLNTIGFLKKAIGADPAYALAHAQLAFAYIWTSMFIEPANLEWAALGKEELKATEALDPQLAEFHFANGLHLWSAYGGFQIDAALRELVLARQLDPNSGHGELAAVLAHAGLEDQADSELGRVLDIDPTSKSLKDLTMIVPYLCGNAEGFAAASGRSAPNRPLPADYYLAKGQLDDAKKVFESDQGKPGDTGVSIDRSLLLALSGEFAAAERMIAEVLRHVADGDMSRHHVTYAASRVHAVAGDGRGAVKWLRETAATGFPSQILFERDRSLDRIRDTPEFVQFMADQKRDWERRRLAFAR